MIINSIRRLSHKVGWLEYVAMMIDTNSLFLLVIPGFAMQCGPARFLIALPCAIFCFWSLSIVELAAYHFTRPMCTKFTFIMDPTGGAGIIFEWIYDAARIVFDMYLIFISFFVIVDVIWADGLALFNLDENVHFSDLCSMKSGSYIDCLGYNGCINQPPCNDNFNTYDPFSVRIGGSFPSVYSCDNLASWIPLCLKDVQTTELEEYPCTFSRYRLLFKWLSYRLGSRIQNREYFAQFIDDGHFSLYGSWLVTNSISISSALLRGLVAVFVFRFVAISRKSQYLLRLASTSCRVVSLVLIVVLTEQVLREHGVDSIGSFLTMQLPRMVGIGTAVQNAIPLYLCQWNQVLSVETYMWSTLTDFELWGFAFGSAVWMMRFGIVHKSLGSRNSPFLQKVVMMSVSCFVSFITVVIMTISMSAVWYVSMQEQDIHVHLYVSNSFIYSVVWYLVLNSVRSTRNVTVLTFLAVSLMLTSLKNINSIYSKHHITGWMKASPFFLEYHTMWSCRPTINARKQMAVLRGDVIVADQSSDDDPTSSIIKSPTAASDTITPTRTVLQSSFRNLSTMIHHGVKSSSPRERTYSNDYQSSNLLIDVLADQYELPLRSSGNLWMVVPPPSANTPGKETDTDEKSRHELKRVYQRVRQEFPNAESIIVDSAPFRNVDDQDPRLSRKIVESVKDNDLAKPFVLTKISQFEVQLFYQMGFIAVASFPCIIAIAETAMLYGAHFCTLVFLCYVPFRLMKLGNEFQKVNERSVFSPRNTLFGTWEYMIPSIFVAIGIISNRIMTAPEMLLQLGEESWIFVLFLTGCTVAIIQRFLPTQYVPNWFHKMIHGDVLYAVPFHNRRSDFMKYIDRHYSGKSGGSDILLTEHSLWDRMRKMLSHLFRDTTSEIRNWELTYISVEHSTIHSIWLLLSKTKCLSCIQFIILALFCEDLQVDFESYLQELKAYDLSRTEKAIPSYSDKFPKYELSSFSEDSQEEETSPDSSNSPKTSVNVDRLNRNESLHISSWRRRQFWRRPLTRKKLTKRFERRRAFKMIQWKLFITITDIAIYLLPLISATSMALLFHNICSYILSDYSQVDIHTFGSTHLDIICCIPWILMSSVVSALLGASLFYPTKIRLLVDNFTGFPSFYIPDFHYKLLARFFYRFGLIWDSCGSEKSDVEENAIARRAYIFRFAQDQMADGTEQHTSGSEKS
eukprot:GHVH01006761.1.p1 GENE.GHVH01006761.1~~GHVH01006761.1.p1  ORF type:complete len:1193 (-),score=130.23 GHVH01006761.1:299-3877(-)